MTLKDYIRIKLAPTTNSKSNKSPNLENIYKEMMKRGHHHREIYTTINEVIAENVKKILDEYKKGKGLK